MSDQEEIVVSPETLERLKEELDDLKTRGRDETGERLQHARELGDIRENAEYDAAKDAQALMEARIRHLEYMIRKAVVREGPVDRDEATPGMIVKVKDEDSGDTEEYLLASSSEEKKEGIRTVTTSSPLGAALVGKQVGERVTVEAPAGKFVVEILELRSA